MLGYTIHRLSPTTGPPPLHTVRCLCSNGVPLLVIPCVACSAVFILWIVMSEFAAWHRQRGLVVQEGGQPPPSPRPPSKRLPPCPFPSKRSPSLPASPVPFNALDQIAETFDLTDTIVFGAERNCWAYQFCRTYPTAPTSYRYLNSGAFLARNGPHFRAFIEAWTRCIMMKVDDQNCVHWFYHRHPRGRMFLAGAPFRIALDHHCRLFQTGWGTKIEGGPKDRRCCRFACPAAVTSSDSCPGDGAVAVARAPARLHPRCCKCCRTACRALERLQRDGWGGMGSGPFYRGLGVWGVGGSHGGLGDIGGEGWLVGCCRYVPALRQGPLGCRPRAAGAA